MKIRAAFALLVLSLLLWPSAVGAVAPIAVKGVVVDGTAGASLAPGLIARLHDDTIGSTSYVDRAAPIGTDGTFAFDNVPMDPTKKYRVTVDYRGASYEAAIPNGASDGVSPITMTVFEPTTSEDVLRISSANWVIQSIDDQKQQVVVLETLDVVNSSDRAYVGDHRGDPGSDAPGVLPRTLRLYLPQGASQFQPLSGLDSSGLLPVAGGFVDTKPILPGVRQVAYTYEMAYAEGGMEIRKSLPYPTAKLRALVPNAGLDYRSDRLVAAGTLDLQGRSYVVLSADQVPANQDVTLDALGFPTTPVGRLDPATVQSVGLGIVAIAIFAAFILGLRAGRSSEADVADPRDELLRSIARLDAQRVSGRIDQRQYEQVRSEKKQALLALATGSAVLTDSGDEDR